MRFDFTCHIPNLSEHALGLEFRLNGKKVGSNSLAQGGWMKSDLDLRAAAADVAGGQVREFVFEIRADRTWQPSLTNTGSQDDRELSIAVCNVEVWR